MDKKVNNNNRSTSKGSDSNDSSRQENSAGLPLSILCLGASLTAGWCKGGREEKPYCVDLQTVLATDSSSVGLDIVASACGFPGNTSAAILAAVQECQILAVRDSSASASGSGKGSSVSSNSGSGSSSSSGNGHGHDIVILMAGTNDLGEHPPPSNKDSGEEEEEEGAVQALVRRLVENLATLHCIAQNNNGPLNKRSRLPTKTITITIPESQAMHAQPWLRRRWQAANDLITNGGLAAAVTQAGGSGDQMTIVNADQLIRFGPLPQQPDTDQWAGLWEPDGLHMTEAGYSVFGKALGRHLLGLGFMSQYAIQRAN